MNPSPELFSKLLPDKVFWVSYAGLMWPSTSLVHETEYLHLCHLAENKLDEGWDIMDSNAPRYKYSRILYRVVGSNEQPFRATWQQRLTALAEVRGLK